MSNCFYSLPMKYALTATSMPSVVIRKRAEEEEAKGRDRLWGVIDKTFFQLVDLSPLSCLEFMCVALLTFLVLASSPRLTSLLLHLSELLLPPL